MSLGMIFSTIFEIALVAFLFWGFFNEDKLIRLEKRIFAGLRRRKLKVLEGEPRSFDKAS